ncbi:MAG: cytochrome c [Wenzhouxiangellaceae bacterium]|nr:cytochrome c [Wenzhouxiangellaceae bacterium]
MKTVKHVLYTALVLIVLTIGGLLAFAYSGVYDVSVGSGHNPVVGWFLSTVRHNSIDRASAGIEVPPLDDATMVESGARLYDQACAGCHGRPGRPPSESFGPRPPAITRHAHGPAYNFWAVRNGIKMSAMPKRGPESMSDEEVWQVVAFLERASALTEGEYRQMVEPPPPEPGPQEAEELADEPGSGEEAESGSSADEPEPGGDETGNSAADEGTESEDDGSAEDQGDDG